MLIIAMTANEPEDIQYSLVAVSKDTKPVET